MLYLLPKGEALEFLDRLNWQLEHLSQYEKMDKLKVLKSNISSYVRAPANKKAAGHRKH